VWGTWGGLLWREVDQRLACHANHHCLICSSRWREPFDQPIHCRFGRRWSWCCPLVFARGCGKRGRLGHPDARQYRICNSIRPSGTIPHPAIPIPPASPPVAGILERGEVAFAATPQSPVGTGRGFLFRLSCPPLTLNRPISRDRVVYPTTVVSPLASGIGRKTRQGAASHCALFCAANKRPTWVLVQRFLFEAPFA
jgi:hypothetical protein